MASTGSTLKVFRFLTCPKVTGHVPRPGGSRDGLSVGILQGPGQSSRWVLREAIPDGLFEWLASDNRSNGFGLVYACSSQGKGTGFARPLQFLPHCLTKLPQGLSETKQLAFAEEQTKSNHPWETYVVRPGYVLSKERGNIVTAIFGNGFLLRVDELAAAMVEIALNGSQERTLLHPALVKKGKEVLK